MSRFLGGGETLIRLTKKKKKKGFKYLLNFSSPSQGYAVFYKTCMSVARAELS